MEERNRNILIVVFNYSVIVKGIERKLTELGYNTMVLDKELNRFRDYAARASMFILYLPNDIVENSVRFNALVHICDTVDTLESPLIVIGEKQDSAQLMKKIPSLHPTRWLDRAVQMDTLEKAVKQAFASETGGGSRRILIVDDDPAYGRMIREWLKHLYQVDILTDSSQVMEFLSKKTVDLILLDYEMPVPDGPQVLIMLRNDPDTQKIPVIFLTGIDNREDVQRVMALKPNGYILKSTPREKLQEQLKEYL